MRLGVAVRVPEEDKKFLRRLTPTRLEPGNGTSDTTGLVRQPIVAADGRDPVVHQSVQELVVDHLAFPLKTISPERPPKVTFWMAFMFGNTATFGPSFSGSGPAATNHSRPKQEAYTVPPSKA